MFLITAIVSALILVPAVAETSPGSDSDLAALASARFRFEPATPATASNTLAPSIDLESDAAALTIAPAAPGAGVGAGGSFGLAESKYWFLSAAGGTDFQDADFGRVGGGISYFIADDFSLDFELDGMYFAQENRDAYAINFNLIMRWHFYNNAERTLSIYADGGAGIMFASDDVPEEGSRFNFTPQLGAGISFDIGNNSRLFTGVRWHHVSNGRLFESNPGTDMAMFYVMLSWPF